MIEIQTKSLQGYKFIDLFAGIGAFHYALKSYGAECVFASEWDNRAVEFYEKNHHLTPKGDITQIPTEEIPPHDILCAGFPCQSFSRIGRKLGFDDPRGNMIFEIARIAKHHQPKVLFLENVKDLLKHDEGRTIQTIVELLNDTGYKVCYKVLNSGDFGVPQHRERVYFVCFRKDIKGAEDFTFPSPINKPVSVYDILEKEPTLPYKIIDPQRVSLNKELLPCSSEPINKLRQVGDFGKGMTQRIYDPIGHCPTFRCRTTGQYYIDGVTRELTPRESARAQGFPDSFIVPTTSGRASFIFGNTITVDVLQYITAEIVKVIENE